MVSCVTVQTLVPQQWSFTISARVTALLIIFYDSSYSHDPAVLACIVTVPACDSARRR